MPNKRRLLSGKIFPVRLEYPVRISYGKGKRIGSLFKAIPAIITGMPVLPHRFSDGGQNFSQCGFQKRKLLFSAQAVLRAAISAYLLASNYILRASSLPQGYFVSARFFVLYIFVFSIMAFTVFKAGRTGITCPVTCSTKLILPLCIVRSHHRLL